MKFQINPDDFKRAKICKPGWYVTLLKNIVTEPNSKKDGFNDVIDAENAEKDSEYFGVPVKHWLSEKGVSMPGGAVAFFNAFNPGVDQTKMAEFDPCDMKGRYIYAKWATSRGKAGDEPPRNVIEDWAPLPSKYAHLKEVNAGESAVTAGVGGFDT